MSARPRTRTLVKLAALGAAVAMLAGCRITGPDFDQTFASRSSQVPLKATVTHTQHPVLFECHQAFHGGLYPAFDSETAGWLSVTSVNAVPSGQYYSASTSAVLPSSCWHQDYTGVWYAAVRARQRATDGTLADKGFPSLTQYSGSSQYIPWVRVQASS